MTDAPERIWACMGGPMVGMFVSGGNNGGWPEYVRADIVQSLPAERDRLRHPAHLHSALRQEIMREIADLPEADLRGVLRMIRVWKGLKND